eukprot:361792-Chlamydomonas_euryale.AAC.5
MRVVLVRVVLVRVVLVRVVLVRVVLVRVVLVRVWYWCVCGTGACWGRKGVGAEREGEAALGKCAGAG